MSTTTLTLPAAAGDLGYFTTKYTYGRRVEHGKSTVSCGSFASIAPRVQKSIGRMLGADDLDGVTIRIEGVDYFVGPDAPMRSTGRDARVVLEQYSTSSEYRALMQGMLYFIAREVLDGKRNIDQLDIQTFVAGLPLNTIDQYSKTVGDIITGQHFLPPLPGRSKDLIVTIKRCEVVAQPQGALVKHAAEKNSKAMDGNTLVLDMGGGTFDWFLTYGTKPMHDRSGAHPKGMLSCAYFVCDQIAEGLRNDPMIVSRVDKAICEDLPVVKIGGKEVDLGIYRPGVDAILSECIHRMLEIVGSLAAVDVILLTGGGGKRLYELLVNQMPDRRDSIHVDSDPIYSNVTGFHYLAELLNRGKA